MVVIEMENGKKIKIELYPEIAPITCANFEKLVKEGFYDGLIFHRVISGFMIQGGDPEGTGMGGAKENIKGEFAQNGVKNDLKHTRGVISMARSMMPDSAEPGAEPRLSRTGDRARASVAQAGLRPRAPHGNLRYRGERFPLKIARAAATLDDFIEKYKICACNLAKSVILSFLAF